MSAQTLDVVIAGAGIVGLSAACSLAKRGLRCLVLDRGLVGREASFAAGGILSPQAETLPDSPLLPLALRARDRHLTLAEELLESTGLSVEHRQDGVLSLAASTAEEASLRALIESQRRVGLRAEMISREELLQLEPDAHPESVGAARFPDDHRVDNRRLMEALRRLAVSRGVELREHTAIRGIKTAEGRLASVRTDDATIETPSLLNALGAWAAQIDGDASAPPVRPVKGHMLSLVDGPSLRHVVYGHPGYIVPRGDGRLIVGSTMEEAGFDRRITAEGIAQLLAIAADIAPATRKASLAEAWVGFRPATPDGLPIIGRGAVEGVVIAGGLFRNGILLGPLVGEIAASLMVGEKPPADITAFSPERFSARSPSP
jgi:glycine oxidase